MEMRRVYAYMIMMISFVACQKQVDTPDIHAPWGGYITFSTGIETKTPINVNMRGKNFGVLAYSYDSNWATARPVSTPDLFYNQTVGCDNNGICTYDADPSADGTQVKEWNLAKTYSFFAYYPTTADNSGISISGSSATDMPKVTYTYPFGTPDANDNANITVPGNDALVDLMTAAATDQTGKGSGIVRFNFEHRLFCFEILANNYNDDTTIDISNLKLKLTGLAYDSMTVPMMASDSKTDVTKTSTGLPASVTYTISDAGKTATIPSFKNGGTSYSLSKNCSSTQDGYIMLIPQDTEISGEFTWDHMPTGSGVMTTFTTNLDFQAGKKYSIIINFAGDAITIAIIEAGTWASNEVNIEFE